MWEKPESIREIPDEEINQVVAWLKRNDRQSLQAYLDKLETPGALLLLQEKAAQHPDFQNSDWMGFELLKLCFAAAQNSHIKAVLKPTQGEADFSFVPEDFFPEGFQA